jgi:uncharacterized protein with LGFP repeats
VPPDLAGQLAGLTVPNDPTAAINAARRAAGGPLGPLGKADGPPYQIGADGLGQNFAGGKIFYTPATGAQVISGQVLAKYESVGGPEGDLGFPTTGEVDGGLATESKMTSFAADDKPVIFWTPDYGAVIVRGAMNAAWQKLDGAKGPLGAPVADQTEDGNVVTQRFSGGVVSWDRAKNSFTTEPSNLASDLSGLQVPGQQAPKAPEQAQAPKSDDNSWLERRGWWLLAIVPILVVVGVVVFATQRRRGDDGDHPGFGDGFGRDEMPVPATVGSPGDDSDDYSPAMFGDRYAREGLGSVPPHTADTDAPQPSVWGAPQRTEAPSAEREHETTGDNPAQSPVEDLDENTDDVDTAPTRVPTVADRDPLTDTGRHARIELDEPEPGRTAFRLPLDDPDEAPEGYLVKADTKTGRYFAPGSPSYDSTRAEIWFSSEEFARTNGFVPGDQPG